jgi:glyoxylase I family protein
VTQPVISIRGLDHVVLRVRQLEPMLRFYCNVLGCSEERRVESVGLVQLRAGNSLIDLVPGLREGVNMDHFCLRIETFDESAIRSHLQVHGIPAGEVATRYGAEGYGPSLYLKDPEGNVVELKGPPQAR